MTQWRSTMNVERVFFSLAELSDLEKGIVQLAAHNYNYTNGEIQKLRITKGVMKSIPFLSDKKVNEVVDAVDSLMERTFEIRKVMRDKKGNVKEFQSGNACLFLYRDSRPYFIKGHEGEEDKEVVCEAIINRGVSGLLNRIKNGVMKDWEIETNEEEIERLFSPDGLTNIN